MGVKLVRLAKGKIIGTEDIHLGELVPVDNDEPTSYVKCWDCSRTANDSVRAYLIGTSGNYTIHVYGTGEMADYEQTSNAPYCTTPWMTYSSNGSVKNINIHEGITYIGARAFYVRPTDNNYSVRITLANSIRTLGLYAFAEWRNVTVVGGNGIRRMLNSCFERWNGSNSGTVSWTIPQSVQCIDALCFAGRSGYLNNTENYHVVGDGCLIKSCVNSSSIVIPSNVKSICLPYITGNDSIVRPTVQQLTAIDLTGASSLKYLGIRALDGHAFSSVDLPASVVLLDGSCFRNNPQLRKVWIPKSVKCIGSEHYPMSTSVSTPFLGCTNNSLKLFCEKTERPAEWNEYWNYTSATTQATVVWGATHSDFEAY